MNAIKSFLKKNIFIVVSSFWFLFLFAFFIFISLNISFSSKIKDNFANISLIFILIICFILFISLNIYCILFMIMKPEYFYIQDILISLFSFNFIFILFMISESKIKWKKIWQKYTIKDITYSSIILSIFIVLIYINKNIKFLGFSTSIHYIPLFLYAYKFSFNFTLYLSLISSTISFLLEGGAVGVWQVILDYYVPFVAISISSLLSFNNRDRIFKVFNYFLFISIPIVIGFLSRSLSGVIFFKVSFSASLIFNSPSYFVRFVFLNLFTPIIIENVSKFLTSYYD